MMQAICERYRDHITGVLSCFDRVILEGNIPGACYGHGMESFLNKKGILFKDYPKFAERLNLEIRDNIERIARQSRLTIEFISRPRDVRKEARVQEILDRRGTEPGIVHIFSAMETCSCYEPARFNCSLRIRGRIGKCLHYYVYLIDQTLGLC